MMKLGCYSEEQLLQYLDGDLNEADLHIAQCVQCQATLQELQNSWDLLGEVPDIEPSYNFRAKVWESIRVNSQPSSAPSSVSWWRRLAAGFSVLTACYLGVIGLNSGLNTTRAGLNESGSLARASASPSGLKSEDYFIPSDAELTVDDLDGETEVRIAAVQVDCDGFEGLGNPSHDLLDTSEI